MDGEVEAGPDGGMPVGIITKRSSRGGAVSAALSASASHRKKRVVQLLPRVVAGVPSSSGKG